jgi:excisionase family DNA binding protein
MSSVAVRSTALNWTTDMNTNRAAYSIAETLALTGLGRDKLYRLINEGQLPARKAGRRTLVLATDLDRFLEALPTIGQAA